MNRNARNSVQQTTPKAHHRRELQCSLLRKQVLNQAHLLTMKYTLTISITSHDIILLTIVEQFATSWDAFTMSAH